MALRNIGKITGNFLCNNSCNCSPLKNFCFQAGKSRVLARSFSNISSNQPDENNNNKSSVNNVKPTIKQQLSGLWKKYGIIAVCTYLSIYIGTLSSIFVSLEYDVFNAATFGLDPVYAISKFCDVFETLTGNHSLPGYVRANPMVGTFAIAWMMTKFTEPVRLGLTVATVPTVAKLIRGEKIDTEKEGKDEDKKKI